MKPFLVLAMAASLVTAATAGAQSEKTVSAPKRAARVGVLYPGVDNSVFRGNFDGFRQGLAAAGYVEGRNLTIQVRAGDGRILGQLATELTDLHPDLIVAVGRPGVVAMHKATSTIPLVAMDLESDPVASGFVQTVPRPGGNLTGVFMDFPELAGKWLEILKTAVPSLARVAVLWDPAGGPAQLDAARHAAQTLKLALHPVEARSVAEIGPAFDAATRERPNGMIVLTSPIFSSGRQTIAEQSAHHRLPTLVPFGGYVKDGGLVAYGPDVPTMYTQAAAIAVKILGGTPPRELPVERPTTFTLSLNLKTAKMLGLTIPQSLLLRANDVIE
jgi:putative ABC transport system substrate-binding protein